MNREDSADCVEGSILHRDDGAVMHVTGEGLWSPAYVDDHFGQLQEALTSLRMGGRRIRVLVDLTAAPVQPAATAERVRHWTERLYEPRDRVAIVVATSLMALQMRRVATIAQRDIFLDAAEGLHWLRADL